MPFEASAIPRAIDGLVAMCNAQAVVGGTLDGVEIYDGYPITLPSGETYLEIATTPDAGNGPAVDGTQDFVSIPGREKDEQFNIYCAAYSRSGNNDVKIERDRAFAIVRAVEAMVRPREPGSDVTLGGAVRWCNVSGRIAYSPLQAQEGCAVRVEFEIVCHERLDGS